MMAVASHDVVPTVIAVPAGEPTWCSHRSSGSAISSASGAPKEEDPMPTEPLRAAEAARRLEIPTKELLRLVYERRIRFVMVDGVAHIPVDAITEYQAKAS